MHELGIFDTDRRAQLERLKAQMDKLGIRSIAELRQELYPNLSKGGDDESQKYSRFRLVRRIGRNV
ncbi:MAG: hypothetical protein AAGF24_05405 [Cyanobacteria bacterium P01_H01_bin.121]